MRNLKAKRDKKKYKDTSHWLDAVYRNNKSFIDEKFKNVKTKNKKRVFKNLVLAETGAKFKGHLTIKELNERLNAAKNPTKALKKLSRSDVFSSYKDRAQQNAYKVIKENKAIQKIKELSGDKGKFDPSKLEWDFKDKVYKYGGAYIELSDSPKGVKVFKKTASPTEII